MQGRPQNYLKKLKSYKFLAFLHLLLDVTKEFSHVFLLFHKNYVSVPEIQDRVNTLNAALDAMQVRPGNHLRELQQSVEEDGTFKEISLTRQPNNVVSFTNIRESLLNASKQYTNNRFSNLVQDPVFKAEATVSDPLGWPRVGDSYSDMERMTLMCLWITSTQCLLPMVFLLLIVCMSSLS